MQAFQQTIRPNSTSSIPFSIENTTHGDAEVNVWLTNPQPQTIFEQAGSNITIQIKTDDELHTSLYGPATLSDWYAHGPAKLGILAEKQSQQYLLTIDSSTLNDSLQRKKITFDITVELKDMQKKAETEVVSAKTKLASTQTSSNPTTSIPSPTPTPIVLGTSTQSAQQIPPAETIRPTISTNMVYLWLLLSILLAIVILFLARIFQPEQ